MAAARRRCYTASRWPLRRPAAARHVQRLRQSPVERRHRRCRAGGDDLVSYFSTGGPPTRVPLGRLGDVRPLYAMTVHRSQGSQFESVTVLLSPASSPLGTRETLYTAETRAEASVRVIGSAAAVLAAVAHRASGLGARLL